MFVVTRSDDQGNEVARLHGYILHRTEGRGLAAIRDAFRQSLPRAAMAQFHRPCHPVSARGVGVRHHALHPQGGPHRALPSDRDRELGSGVHDDTMPLHIAGYLHHLVSGIRHQIGQVSGAPAFYKIILARFLMRRGQMVQLDLTARSDAQKAEPFLQRFRIHAVLGGQSGLIHLPLGGGGFLSGGEHARGGLEIGFAVFGDCADEILCIAQEDRRAAGNA